MQRYLAERRALGFDLRIPGDQITAFARFVDAAGHSGPITTRIILDWVQGQSQHAKPSCWARRLDILRPFARYLARLDPETEFPQTAIFGRAHRRLAPHIYSEQEICDLLAAARRLAPHGGLLDRLTHHVSILEMNGDSYRLAQSRAKQFKENS